MVTTLAKDLLNAPPALKTVDDLYRLAGRLQGDCAHLYKSLAREMHVRGRDDMTALFTELAAEEDRRRAQTEALVKAPPPSEQSPLAPPRTKAPRADSPDRPRPALMNRRLTTPYRALAFAVEMKEDIFKLYSYLTAASQDKHFCQCAERLAKAELVHAAALRARRRQAYHAEKGARAGLTWPAPERIETPHDLMSCVRAMEGRTVQRYRKAAQKEGVLSHYSDLTTRLVEQMTRTAETLGLTPDQRPAEATGQSGMNAFSAPEAPEEPVAALQQALSESERAFEFYNAVLTQTENEDTMRLARCLCEESVPRLSLVWERLQALLGGDEAS